MLNMLYASANDAFAVYQLSQEPLVRSASLESSCFSYSEHIKWFKSKLLDDNFLFLLFFEEKDLAAQIRYEIIENVAEISISISESYRGKGLSGYILDKSITELKKRKGFVKKIKAVIKNNNKKSELFFKKNNFVFESTSYINNQECSIFYLDLES